MSKKIKGVVLDSVDAKASFKYQTLVQDYGVLQKEDNVMRSKLEMLKKRKLTLAAEVRFLRRRYKYLMETNPMISSKGQALVETSKLLNLNKNNVKESTFSRKESALHRLPPIPTPKPKKKLRIVKETTPYGASLQVHSAKEDVRNSLTPTPGFDLTKGNSCIEASLPSRAPIFDLNEISTGDAGFESNGEALKFEENKRDFIIGVSDEHQNELKLSMCRKFRGRFFSCGEAENFMT